MVWRIHFTADDIARIQVSPTLGPLASGAERGRNIAAFPAADYFRRPCFVLPYAAETILRLHDEPIWPRHSSGPGTMDWQ